MNGLKILLVILALMLTGLILIQAKGAGLSGVFGGGDGNTFKVKRGAEKGIYWLTIIISIIFFVLSFFIFLNS